MLCLSSPRCHGRGRVVKWPYRSREMIITASTWTLATPRAAWELIVVSTITQHLAWKHSQKTSVFEYLAANPHRITGVQPHAWTAIPSASFSAEISVTSPRKLFIFIIYKILLWIKVSKKHFIWFWEQKHWPYLGVLWQRWAPSAVSSALRRLERSGIGMRYRGSHTAGLRAFQIAPEGARRDRQQAASSDGTQCQTPQPAVQWIKWSRYIV